MECLICLDNIDENIICNTYCNHHFCYNCLCKWLELNNNCPACRCEINDFKYKNEKNKIIYINNSQNLENINQNIQELVNIYNNSYDTYRKKENKLKKIIIFLLICFLSTIFYLFMIIFF